MSLAKGFSWFLSALLYQKNNKNGTMILTAFQLKTTTLIFYATCHRGCADQFSSSIFNYCIQCH
jgi:hypothetical protein